MRRLLLGFALLGLLSCDVRTPSETSVDGPAPVAASVISDGQEDGGNPFFHFLNPIRAGKPSRVTGAFASDLHEFLTVEICELQGDACVGPPLVTMTADGPTGRFLEMDEEGREFKAEFSPGAIATDATSFRVKVAAGPIELGYADIDRLTPPIRFTVMEGALASAGAGLVGPAGALVHSMDGAVALSVPAGALASPAVLAIKAGGAEPPRLPPGMVGIGQVGPVPKSV